MATSKDFYDLAKTWADSGQGYIEVPAYGYQCIGLIVGLNKALNAGLQPVISDGTGRAKCFYTQYAEGWIPTPAGWHTVAGNTRDDAEAARIYNSLPNGAICCWETTGNYSYYGHISIKAGNWGKIMTPFNKMELLTPNPPIILIWEERVVKGMLVSLGLLYLTIRVGEVIHRQGQHNHHHSQAHQNHQQILK